MLLGEPRPTPYDLHFDLFGIPVRVNPLFFLLPLFFTIAAGDIVITLIFAVIFFVSILIHELGHALAFGYYGMPSRIVLYMMGGLATPNTSPWQVGSKSNISAGQQIMISAAGPFAGFLLAAIIALIAIAMGGEVQFGLFGIIPLVFADLSSTSVSDNLYLILLIQYAIWINFYLNLINLLPVFPLDGGQIARQIFVINDPWHGVRNSLILSLVIGGAVGGYMLFNGEFFIGFMFAMFAYNSWLSLQQYGNGGFGGRPW